MWASSAVGKEMIYRGSVVSTHERAPKLPHPNTNIYKYKVVCNANCCNNSRLNLKV